jgi:hypothetical protein
MGLAIGLGLGLTFGTGGGVPETIVVNGVTYELLYGKDGSELQGADGAYLYGRTV